MPANGTVWRIATLVSTDAVEITEAALEPFCPALTIFETHDGSGQWRMEGFSEIALDAVALQRAVSEMADIQGVGAPTVQVDEMVARNWVQENQDSFPALIVGRYYVFGDHVEETAPLGRVALRVDPGAAFGSGRHESTSGCLAAFERLARRKKFEHMLDMGCGSGILSLAMAKTWRGSVLAVDNDQDAVTVTAANARLNGEATRVRAYCGAGYASARVQRAAPYDLIVANILARPLRKMAKDAARALSDGGYLILAGFLTRDWRFVYSPHQMQGLALVDKIDTNEWTTLVLKKGR